MRVWHCGSAPRLQRLGDVQDPMCSAQLAWQPGGRGTSWSKGTGKRVHILCTMTLTRRYSNFCTKNFQHDNLYLYHQLFWARWRIRRALHRWLNLAMRNKHFGLHLASWWKRTSLSKFLQRRAHILCAWWYIGIVPVSITSLFVYLTNYRIFCSHILIITLSL